MIGKDEAPHPYASDMMDAYKPLNTTGAITGTITNTAEPSRWKFCPECGTKLDPGWRHCPKCGGVIGQTAAPWVPANPLYPQPWVTPNVGPWYPPQQPWITWGPNVAGSATGGITDCGRTVTTSRTSGVLSVRVTTRPKPGDQVTYTA
jgi:hypothetical protein